MRVGNRIYCSGQFPPPGLTFIHSTRREEPGFFRNLLGEKIDAISWVIKGWSK